MGEKGSKKGLFENWFSMFVSNVFIQSFQAVFLMFLLQFISAVQKSNASDMLVALFTIAGLAGIIKFEGLIKEIFQVKESKSGSFGRNFYGTMQGIRHGSDLVSRTSAPFKNYADVKRKRISLDNEIAARKITDKAKLKEGEASGGTPNVGGTVVGGTVAGGTIGGTVASQILNPQYGGASRTIIDANGNPISSGRMSNGPAVAASANGQNISGGSFERMEASLDKLARIMEKSTGVADNSSKSIPELEKQRDELKLQESKLGMQRFTRLGTTLAAVGGALGANDRDFGETMTLANIVDRPLDAASDKAINSKVYKPRYKEALQNYNQAIQTKSPDAMQAFKDLESASKTMHNSLAREAEDFARSAVNSFTPSKELRKKRRVDIDNIDII